MKKNKKIQTMGPIVEIIFLIFVVSILSFVFNIFNLKSYLTEAGTFETTQIVVNNILSFDGLKYILNNTLTNFQMLEPLILIILSLIAISILEASGLLKHVFSPLKKIKLKYIIGLVMLVGIISTIIGDYSYAILIPISGILYKYLDRSPSLGILTMFIAITIGYGTGIIYNYQAYQLGNITEMAASSITSEYNYELLSNIFLLVASTIIMTIVGTIILDKFSKKYVREEYNDNLNISKKAGRITLVTFIILCLCFIYCLIPGFPKSGLLLDKTEPTYIGKLFGGQSLLSQGFMVLIIVMLMLCGLVYGKVSKNIKSSKDYSNALTKTFENTGYVFVLLFFASVLYEIIEWTNISTVISTKIVDFIGASQLSGLLLIVAAIVSIILISIIIPGTMNKWEIVAPIYIPLLMRANISPAFTQTLFQVSDSMGKLFSPIYVYLIITIGFMYKYNKEGNVGIISTMKKIMPVILLLSLTWLVILLGWYLLGLPIGIGSSITL